MGSKDTFILVFTKPKWKVPIVIAGDDAAELDARVDRNIKDEDCDVSIAARTDSVDINVVQEITAMILVKGHHLSQVQNDLYVQTSVFAIDYDGHILDSWWPTVSSISEKALDVIYDSLFGSYKQQALLAQTKEFRYGCFNEQTNQDWTKLVGNKIEKHFNKRLKGFKKMINKNGKTRKSMLMGNVILTFTRPKYKEPIVLIGKDKHELYDEIKYMIKDKPWNVTIEEVVDEDGNGIAPCEIQEIACMVLSEGHHLLESEYCPKINLVATNKYGSCIGLWHLKVSNIASDTLDSIYDSIFRSGKYDNILEETEQFRYLYFDPQTKRDWIYNVGCIVKDHFNRKLDYRKRVKESKHGKTN